MVYDPAHYAANRETYLARSMRYWATHKAERAAYNAAHREEKRVYNRAYLLARYGLTPEAFDAMLAAQNGACAVCHGLPGAKGWQVDHDHESTVVRGILCGNCNTLLGLARDDEAVLLQAITYLRKAR